MIKCNKCGFGHKSLEEHDKCKSWKDMQRDLAKGLFADWKNPVFDGPQPRPPGDPRRRVIRIPDEE